MRIALVCPYDMLDHPGGVQQVVMHLYKALKKKGHYVKIITQRPSNFKGKVPEDYILFGVTRKFKGGFGTEGGWGMPSDGDEIARVLEEENFDIINFHEPWMPMLAWQMVKTSKAAHVATFHANLMDTAAGKAWTVLRPYGVPLLSKMDIFSATSPASAGMLIERADMKSARQRWLIENLKYLPCGVELRDFKPVKKPLPLNGPNTKTIVYVGRLEKRKGVDWLIKAFAELVKQMPEAHLIIAGRGLWDKKLREYVEIEQIPNIKFEGYVSDEEKRRLVGNADVTCYAAPFGEGFGVVLLESMAMGVPTIGGNNLGYSTVLQGHGRLGLVDPEATTDFANRLNVFLTDDSVRRLVRNWGLEEVKKFDYPKIATMYEKVFKEAIAINKAKHKPIRGKDADKAKKAKRRYFIRRHA